MQIKWNKNANLQLYNHQLLIVKEYNQSNPISQKVEKC